MAGFRDFFGWPALGDKTDPKWVADQQGWITAMFSLGCIVGSLPSGALTDYLGEMRVCVYLCVYGYGYGK